jgi:aldehyde dehydrogenase (NAD(P)+)
MLKLADLVEQHRETLATIETWDNGMPLLFTCIGLKIH